MNTDITNWTLDELQVAITTMEHDLRGSWNGDYVGRMRSLCELCEVVMAHFESGNAKQAFKDSLKGKADYEEMALSDFGLATDEMTDPYDGRTFRDSGMFYDIPLSEAGKTDRVLEWLNMNVDCDEYHWFQREDMQ